MTRRRTRHRRRLRPRVLPSAVLLLALAATGTALTASLSGVPPVSADQEVRAHPTYTASAPSYADVSGATTVTFTLTPAAGKARARVDTGDPLRTWEDCTSGDSGKTWTCPVPGLTVADATAGTFEWVAVP